MLLILLILVWAASWPIMKIGVATVPPIWFACLRYAVATAVLVPIVWARGELRWPAPTDRRLVLVSGLLQMAAFAALTMLALTILPPGRASILAYSTPLWVHPLAVWRRQERTSSRSALGVVAGLMGIVVIASPTLVRGGLGALGASAMLVTAAGAWAVAIVFVRAHRFTANPLGLAPWQTAVATLVLLLVAVMTEAPPRAISGTGLLALLYAGVMATAFAYWAVVEVGRRLPATTLSVGLLATPTLGLTISAITLNEPIGPALLWGLALVGVGIALTTRGARPRVG
jgi:drug/metabolite transporter (DMT)-like permease